MNNPALWPGHIDGPDVPLPTSHWIGAALSVLTWVGLMAAALLVVSP